MNNSIKAISRIFAAIIKINVTTGDCVVIKSSSVLGMDFEGVVHVSDLITRLQKGLLQESDAPRMTDFVEKATLETISEEVHLSDDFQFSCCGWLRLSLIADLEEAEPICLLTLSDINIEKQIEQRRQKELERNNHLLKEALAVANHANQAKTTFLNSMSHDIRTPMNAIIGFTSLAAAHIDSRDAVADYLKKITIREI